MSPYAVRIGSVLALALGLPLFAGTRACAAERATYIYEGKQFIFQTLLRQSGGMAVSADDPALRALVHSVGATLTWDSDNQYVLITFPGPIVISFAIGDPHYLAGPVSQSAAFAPFLRDGHAYVPLNDVLRALKLPALQDTSAQTQTQPSATPLPSASPEAVSPSAALPQITPAPSPALAQVTAVDVQPQPGGAVIRITVSGNASYEWRRLRPPDNRWWIDIHGARLAIAAIDESAGDPLTAVRAHQESADTVRIALSLSAFNDVDVTPDATGISITVANRVAQGDAPHSGSGTIGLGASATAIPSPARYVASNPNLVVLDPGHGGSDPGTVRGGVQEKNLTLDIAARLRTILIAQGWQVAMTRDGDRDVFAPNDSGQDELQARDDIANSKGARLLVSVHVNSYFNAGPHGVTTFYYKGSDFALAQAIDRRVAAELGLKDNGVIKDKLYVVHHANMPAALIETAFISNPDDFALLQSPDWRQRMAQAIADGIADYAERN